MWAIEEGRPRLTLEDKGIELEKEIIKLKKQKE
jgi:hypothetical protein